jgi:ArsR family transcriptional regulator
MFFRIYKPMQQPLFFQILSDETRLRALALMAREGELCVCELVQALGVSQPKISRHLGALREAGIVGQRRHAQWVYYRIRTDLPDWQAGIITTAMASLEHERAVKEDKRRLDAMKNRPEHGQAA